MQWVRGGRGGEGDWLMCVCVCFVWIFITSHKSNGHCKQQWQQQKKPLYKQQQEKPNSWMEHYRQSSNAVGSKLCVTVILIFSGNLGTWICKAEGAHSSWLFLGEIFVKFWGSENLCGVKKVFRMKRQSLLGDEKRVDWFTKEVINLKDSLNHKNKNNWSG